MVKDISVIRSFYTDKEDSIKYIKVYTAYIPMEISKASE